mgnify:CR=1 FL=1
MTEDPVRINIIQKNYAMKLTIKYLILSQKEQIKLLFLFFNDLISKISLV